jgi:hypothetical protein
VAVDLNTALAIAILDTYDTHFPAGSLLEFRTSTPAGADQAAGGVLLATITSPATPWAAAGGTGSKAKANTWSVAASGAGTIGHYRFKNAAGTKIEEGTVTATGGGGDITVDNLVIAIGQVITVNTFTKTL